MTLLGQDTFTIESLDGFNDAQLVTGNFSDTHSQSLSVSMVHTDAPSFFAEVFVAAMFPVIAVSAVCVADKYCPDRNQNEGGGDEYIANNQDLLI